MDGAEQNARNTKTWLGGFIGTLARLVDPRPAAIDAERLQHDVHMLVEPALPLLMHKRQKILSGSEPVQSEQRWHDELGFYVDRILWPMLGVESDRRQTRSRVIGLIDAMVTERQAHAGEIAFDRPLKAWQG